jgi:hypothetical protein
MQQSSIKKNLSRNPQAFQKHRKEVLWQITIPVLIGALILISVGLMIALGAGIPQTSKIADISLIWLIVPAMIITLIFGAVLFSLIVLVVRLIQVLPLYTNLAHDYLKLFSLRLGRISNRLVEPFLRIHSLNASRRALSRNLRWKTRANP